MPAARRAAWSLGAVVLAGAVTLAACGRSELAAPPAQAPAPETGSAARADADALAARGDWGRAVARYGQALREAPSDVGLRYGLGVALSHLGRREDAIAQLRWVAFQDAGGHPEVEVARGWLFRMGVRLDGQGDVAPPGTDAAGMVGPAPGEPHGQVRGRTVWPGVTPSTRPMNLQMLLEPDGLIDRGRHFWTRTHVGEPYAFGGVPPGAYRLVAQVGSVRLWEIRLSVEADRDTILDLTPDLSAVSPDRFPLPSDR